MMRPHHGMVHQVLVPVDCTIIRHGIGAWAVCFIQQTLINRIAAFSLCLVHGKTQEMVTKPLNAIPGEDAKNISLGMCKFGWSIAAEAGQIVAEKCLHAGQ